MQMVAVKADAFEARWRPGASPLPAAVPPAARYNGRLAQAPRRALGQAVVTANPLDSRAISFLANAGGAVISFYFARLVQGGFWRTTAVVIGVITGLRAMNDFFQMTGVGMKSTQV